MNTAFTTKKKIWLILSLVLILIFSFVALLVRWGFSVWHNLDIDELIYHLNAPLEGTGDGLIVKFVLNSIVPAALLTLCFGILFFLLGKTEKFVPVSISVTTVCVLAGSVALGYTYHRLDMKTYIADHVKDSPFIKDHYVDPRSVEISFPKRKRNLIFIYLESMEMTFADRASGGDFEENIIPELTELSLKTENFSGGHTKLNGGYVLPGTTFTMGGMFAETSGLPLKISALDRFQKTETGVEGVFNDMDSQKVFFPEIMTLGDILHKEDYSQVLLIGSDATFGGRRLYFTEHGDYEMRDYLYAMQEGLIPHSYRFGKWGFEDEKLFIYAKDTLKELSQKEQPFNLTLLTVDTHFEDGNPCRLCRNDFDDQYSNVYACSSRQVAEFVHWVTEQDFYENTTIILSGDHLTMDSDFCDNVEEDYDRRVYNAFINSAPGEKGKEMERAYTTLDIFPTTLAALGADIEGNRLGLGTNLYSSEKTLVEKYGMEELTDLINKRSVFMEELAQFDPYSEKFLSAVGPSVKLRIPDFDPETQRMEFYLWDVRDTGEDVDQVIVEWFENDRPDDISSVELSVNDDGVYQGEADLSAVDITNTTMNIYALSPSGMRYLLDSLGPDPSLYEFHTYMQYLKEKLEKEDYTLLISAKDDASEGLQERDLNDLKALGLKTDLSDEYRSSYAAVVDSAGQVYEETSKDIIEHHGKMKDGKDYYVISAGYDADSFSSILINEVEYSPADRGLNFVLYNNGTGEVEDSVCFDTSFWFTVTRNQVPVTDNKRI